MSSQMVVHGDEFDGIEPVKIHGKNKQQFLGIMYSKKISHPFRTKSARKSFSSFLVLHEIFAKFQIDFIFLPMQND